MDTSAPPDVDGAAALRRLSRRVLPFLFALALLAYLDRANISFGARDLLADTGLGDAQYGLGGSAFFVGYAMMQLPSLCGARRFGAPRWLAFILFCWGVTSMSFAALRGAGGAAEFAFYALRLLLGCFEAGCFPTIWYYLSLAYAADELTEAYPRVTIATAVSGALGGLVAAAILSLDGAGGVRGWQWPFARGRPHRPRGAGDAAALPRDPAHAPWPGPTSATGCAPPRGAHRGQDVVARAGDGPATTRRPTLAAVRNWRTWWAAATWALQCVAYYGILCSAARRPDPPDASTPAVALVSAILFTAAAAAMLSTRALRRASERRWHRAAPPRVRGRARADAARRACVGAARARPPHARHVGRVGNLRPFLFLARHVAAPDEAAAAVATINSVGQAGGLVGPALVGVLSDAEGGVEAAEHVHAMLALAAAAGAAALSLTFAPQNGRPPCAGRSERGALPPVTEAL